MLKRFMFKSIKYALFLFFSAFLLTSCETGVENSPQPGILEITLRANPEETFIVERSDTFSVFTPYQTRFLVSASQCKAYGGQLYATIFPTTTSVSEPSIRYDLFEMEEVSRAGMLNDYKAINTLINDEKISYQEAIDRVITDEARKEFITRIYQLENGEVKVDALELNYKTHMIFRSYLPPGNYDRIEFSLGKKTVEESAELNDKVYIRSTNGKTFEVPLKVPPEDDQTVNFDAPFTISEGATTRISLEIDPSSSVYRFKDSFYFTRNIRIISITQ